MAYDDVKDKPQGSIKTSELFSDKDLDIIKTGVGESGIKILEQLVRISGDALRRLNYILFSTGQINWDGNSINFHANSRNNDVYFRLLQTESSAPRTIDLKMVASTTNSANTFNSLDLSSNGDLIYLELDRSTILSGSSTVILENAVTGGSSNTGYTVKKTNILTAGMPPLSSEEGQATQTFYIPLAMRVDWSDGSTNYNDVWWIPHGIRWPKNTTSTLGSVIVKGLETLPTVFVRTQQELQDAITYFVADGGYILATSSFTIDTFITLPSGVTFSSRSRSDTNNPATITLASTGRIILSSYSTVERVYFTTNSAFGSVGDNTILQMAPTTTRGVVRDCSFNLSNANDSASNFAIAIRIYGNESRINNCRFTGCDDTHPYRIGIDYAGGNNNVDLDSIFD